MSLQIQIGADIGNVDKAISQVSNSLNNIKAPAANAQAALFSVSQVTRDLPFGFIAIQNNLPQVIDSFGALTKASGGIGGAFKALGATLAGPAGISFAFGAAIAGVTALTQKYGSLGNAVKELFGINTQLTESQKAYNEQVAKSTASLTTEQAKVDILTKTLLNNTKSQGERLAAYNELKKIAPDVVAGIKDENALTQASNLLIQQQAEQRKQLIRLKIQEAGINAALNTSAEKLAVADRELTDAKAEQTRTFAALQAAQKNTLVQGPALTQLIQNAFRDYQNASTAVKDLEVQTSSLRKEQDQYLAQLDPIVNQIAQSNKATNDRVVALKKQIDAENKALENQKKLNKAKLLDTEFEGRVSVVNILRQQNLEQAKLATNLAKENKALAFGPDGAKGPGAFVPGPAVLEADKRLQQITNSFNAARQNLESVFFSPLTNLFDNFLQTGKFAFKDFARSIIAAISQIVAKIIATGIINLLANIFLAGAPSAIGAATGAGKGIAGAFGAALNSVFGLQKVAAPSFSNVNGGNLGLTGAVNLTLRGSDLVGAMNRTNTTINRVG